MKKQKIIFIVFTMVCCVCVGILVRQMIQKDVPPELGYHDVEENDIYETGYIDGAISSGPLNPAFMEFADEPGASRKSVTTDLDDRDNFGWIPSPDIPEVRKSVATKAKVKSLLVTKYDLRDPNSDGDLSDSMLSPVRDQGSCGACWVFATYGSIEANLMGFMATWTTFLKIMFYFHLATIGVFVAEEISI
jgi:hypothetical protein